MKVLIRVKRVVELCSIVEMPEEKFREIDAALDSDDRATRCKAEWAANELVDARDWQDDEFDDLYAFEEYKPTEEPK